VKRTPQPGGRAVPHRETEAGGDVTLYDAIEKGGRLPRDVFEELVERLKGRIHLDTLVRLRARLGNDVGRLPNSEAYRAIQLVPDVKLPPGKQWPQIYRRMILR